MSWNLCKQPECEAYTARPDGDYCESCRRKNAKESENEKRSEERKKSQLKKAKAKQSEPRPMPNKVSAKRKELNEEYFKLVEQFKKDNPKCKANVNEYCTKNTTDPHHTKGRGEYLLEVSTWLPVCRSCHQFIEAHPKEAKEKGWSESRLQTVKQTV